jgi:hypothetical protein
MSYHPFPNMRDIFQSQLSAKMIENVESLDYASTQESVIADHYEEIASTEKSAEFL